MPLTHSRFITSYSLQDCRTKTEKKKVEASRARLAAFLTDLQPILAEQEKSERKPVLGTNPRMRQLARSFLSAKRNRRQFRSVLFHDTLADAQRLLFSDSEEDRKDCYRF
jgi:flagellar biosynthesis component FlhA